MNKEKSFHIINGLTLEKLAKKIQEIEIDNITLEFCKDAIIARVKLENPNYGIQPKKISAKNLYDLFFCELPDVPEIKHRLSFVLERERP